MPDKFTPYQEELIAFMQRNGFIWGPEPEIYGGVSGFYTFGPLGKLLKNNIENKIKQLAQQNDFWEVECPIVMPKEVWEASGHLKGFVDPLIECSKCKASFRADKLIEEKEDVSAGTFSEKQLIDYIKKHDIKCPSCKGRLNLEIKKHNLMMKTTVGRDKEAYNRPETATTTYLPFRRYCDFFRKKIPFGVFQIGKAFRNEISPRQHSLRGREFTQAEIQVFLTKKQKEDWEKFDEIKNNKLPLWPIQMQKSKKGPGLLKMKEALDKKYMRSKGFGWCLHLAYTLFTSFGIPPEKIRIRQHFEDEKAFYAEDAWDIEIELKSFGWTEVCGVHDRSDYDLKTHSKHSGQDLIFDDGNEKIHLNVLEIAFGSDRPVLALLDLFYEKEKERIILKLPADMAPVQVAVFPLVEKDNLPELAEKIYGQLKQRFIAFYDTSGSIGRRYARQDEKGTPFCITIDYDSLKKKDITIRERDSTKQIRIPINKLEETLTQLLKGEKLNKFGKFVN